MKNERDVRLDVVNSILSTPHRKVEPLIPIHMDAQARDPLFYAKMSVWYALNGNIRDHQKLFASKMITSEYHEFRGIGEALFNRMPIRQAHATATIAFDHFKGKSGGKRRRLRKVVEKQLRELESRAHKDKGISLLRNAKIARKLFRTFHIAPGSDIVASSLKFRTSVGAEKYAAFDAIKEIAHSNDESRICELIDKNRIPFLHVVGAVKEVTPAIAVAVLGSMTGPEIVNNMKLFESRGLLDIPEVKALVNSRLKKSKSKTASLRTTKAAKSMKKHSDVMDTATNQFVDTLPSIDREIVVAIDKSYSMEDAIALGKEVATILSAKVVDPEKNLHVCVFDKLVSEVDITGKSKFTDFESQFRYIKPNGTTSLGAVIAWIDEKGFSPEVVLFITDADENSIPYLDNAVRDSKSILGSRIINCRVGNPSYDLKLSEQTARAKSIEVENIKYDGDYYSLPNLVRLIASGGVRDLIKEIDAIDLDAFVEGEK